jgi:hypothetical protein
MSKDRLGQRSGVGRLLSHPAAMPSKAEDGWLGRRQKLRTLETEPAQNRRPTAKPNHRPFGADPDSRPSPDNWVCEGLRKADESNRRTRGSGGHYLFKDVPTERRSSQASTMRLAIFPSASFPQARGSYAFLFPTSPSTLSTPS